jgi:hypothetical protein
MQAIKSLVIGLGILIIAGLILLGYAFYARMTDPEFRLMKAQREQTSTSRASSRADAGFGEAGLPLPEGCSLVEMKPDGKWLYLRTGPAGACERIIIVDALSGRVHGILVVKP